MLRHLNNISVFALAALVVLGCSETANELSGEAKAFLLVSAINSVKAAQNHNDRLKNGMNGLSSADQQKILDSMPYPKVDLDIEGALTEDQEAEVHALLGGNKGIRGVTAFAPPGPPTDPGGMDDFNDQLGQLKEILTKFLELLGFGGDDPADCKRYITFGCKGKKNGKDVEYGPIKICVDGPTSDCSQGGENLAELKQKCEGLDGVTCTDCGDPVNKVEDWMLNVHNDLCFSDSTVTCKDAAGDAQTIGTGTCS